MKEKIYTIPINDAFSLDSECPVCVLEKNLEDGSIEFFLGPSNMESSCRLETNRKGFCRRHFEGLYRRAENKLGLSLIIETRLEQILAEMKESHGKAGKNRRDAIRKTKHLIRVLETGEHSCAICDRMERIMEKYLHVILWLYFRDREFQIKVKTGKGLCLRHYRMILQLAIQTLSPRKLRWLLLDLSVLMECNLNRVLEDVRWFSQKYDYRNADAPWKTSIDAVPRSIEKMKSYLL